MVVLNILAFRSMVELTLYQLRILVKEYLVGCYKPAAYLFNMESYQQAAAQS